MSVSSRLKVVLIMVALAAHNSISPSTNVVINEKSAVDFLDLYDARTGGFLGLKLSSSVPKISTLSEGGSLFARSFVVDSQADYTDTFSSDSGISAELAILGLKGGLSGEYSYTKFGVNKKNSLIGLIVLERVVKVQRMDPCDPGVYSTIQSHMLSETAKATHVVVGFVNTCRVEIAFVMSKERLVNTTTSKVKLDLEAVTEILGGSVSGRAGIQSLVNDSASLRYSYVTAYSNVAVPLKYLPSKDLIDQYLADLYDYISALNQTGARSEAIMLDMTTVAKCLGTDASSYTYPVFNDQIAYMLNQMYRNFEDSRGKVMSFYEKFHSFRECFSDLDQMTTTTGALNVLMTMKEIVDVNMEEISKYKRGEMNDTMLVKALPDRNLAMLKNFTSLKSSKYAYSTSVDDGLSIYELISTYNVKCWPADEKHLQFDSSFDGIQTKLLIFKNLADLRSSLTELQNHARECMPSQCRKCVCFLVNCAYAHDICLNITRFPAVKSNYLSSGLTSSDTDIAKEAFFYLMKRLRYSDLVVKNMLENQNELSKWARERDPALSKKLKNMSKVLDYYNTSTGNTTAMNAVERFLGMKIVYSDSF